MITKRKIKLFFAVCSSLAIILTCAGSIQAGDFNISTYYPSPYVGYEKLRLFPRATAITESSCDSGKFYVEKYGQLHFCVDAGLGNDKGTWGQIAGLFTQKGDNIYPVEYTNPNLRLGIGTTAPSMLMDFFGSGEAIISGDAPQLTLDDTSVGEDGFSFKLDNNYLNIISNGTNLMTLGTNGNVGINQSNPQAKLHVNGDHLVSGTEVRLKNAAPVFTLEETDKFSFRLVHENTWFSFESNSSGAWEGKFKMSDGSGSALAKNSLTIEREFGPHIRFYSSGYRSWEIRNAGTWLSFSSKNDDATILPYNKNFNISNRTDWGQGIWLPKDATNSNYVALGSKNILLWRWTPTPTDDRIYARTSTSDPLIGGRLTAAGNFVNFDNTPHVTMLPTYGDITKLASAKPYGASLKVTGVFTDLSSRAVKEQIEPLGLSAALDAIDKLEPVTYDFKNSDHKTAVGFIAEDVPDLVAASDRKSVNPMDFIGVLTKVVQYNQNEIKHQSEQLDQQKKKLDDMENKLNALQIKGKEHSAGQL